MKAIRFE